MKIRYQHESPLKVVKGDKLVPGIVYRVAIANKEHPRLYLALSTRQVADVTSGAVYGVIRDTEYVEVDCTLVANP